MDTTIYHPLKEFESKYKNTHEENTRQFFEALVKDSGVDIASNRQTVGEYEKWRGEGERLKKLNRRRRLWRVLACISIVLIPLVIWKLTPQIRATREETARAEKKAQELLALAKEQMLPLMSRFGDTDALKLVQSALPLLSFAPCFSVEQETDMKINYDFGELENSEQSTLDVLAGKYNENPFLFENKLVHTMGEETYHGYKTIYWTETYRDSSGKTATRTRSQTLHATLVRPKPFYSTRVVLNYCSQGGPDLRFHREARHLHQKTDKEIEKLIKQGEKKLKKKEDKALRKGGEFTQMANTDFEVLFGALDRSDEVQFRTLFTPLAQTNLVDLIRSKQGYGDDFSFTKEKRSNQILSCHSAGRDLRLRPCHYASHSFDEIQKNFIEKNGEFFKAVYFDFAPLWAIPMYQERPVHSLKPVPPLSQGYSLKECEALANAVDLACVAHPDSKTRAIVKSAFVHSQNGVDQTRITAYSYDIARRLDFVPVPGGDGRIHSVPVEWDEYLPLEASKLFCICAQDGVGKQTVMARRDGLCMYESEN